MANPGLVRGLPGASYARTSSDQRGRHTSTRDQHAANEREAAALGVELVRRYTDDDRSASRRATRPRGDWEQLVADVESGAVRVVVATEHTRCWRDLDVFLPFRQLLMRTGALLVYGFHVYDLADISDRRHATADAANAEAEADTIAARSERTRTLAAERGDPHGHIPYGYRRRYSERTGQLLGQEIEPAEADVVREIVRRLIAGQGTQAIARDLTARGITPPAASRGDANARPTWRGEGVRWIAVRPLNAGYRTARGELIRGTWDPIIPEAEWHQVRALLAAPARRAAAHPSALRHRLSGAMGCGRPLDAAEPDGIERPVPSTGEPIDAVRRCGGIMGSAHTSSRTSASTLVYQCTRCQRVRVHAGRAEHLVEALLVGRLLEPDAAAALRGDHSDRERQLLAEIAEAEREIAEARRLVERRELSVIGLSAAERAQMPVIERARAELRRLSLPAPLLDLAGPDAAALWDRRTVAEQRAAIMAGMHITVMPARARGSRDVAGRLDVRWLF